MRIFLFVSAFSLALFCQLWFGWSHNCDLTIVMNVGKEAPLHPFVEKDYGSPLCLAPGIGHDGTLTYLIARDPWLTGEAHTAIATSAESISYRYRRIALSVLGSLGGTLAPHATLWGLVLVQSLAIGSAVVLLHSLIASIGGRAAWILILIANPGIFNSLLTLTADPLAISFSLAGFSLFMSGSIFWSAGVISLAALSKEYYLLVAASFGMILAMKKKWREAVTYIVISIAPLLLWCVYVQSMTSQGSFLDSKKNITLPFAGIVESFPTWITETTADKMDHIFVFFLIGTLIVQLVRLRNSTATAITLPWLILWSCLGSVVWDVGNNIGRACAFGWILLFLNFYAVKKDV